MSHTTASRAPRRVASAAAFQVHSRRAISMAPSRIMKNTAATIANSTAATPRWLPSADARTLLHRSDLMVMLMSLKFSVAGAT